MKWNIFLGVLLLFLSGTIKVFFSSQSVSPYNYIWSISFALHMIGLCYISLYLFSFFKVKNGRVSYVFLGALSYEFGKYFYEDAFKFISIFSLLFGYFVFVTVQKYVRSNDVKGG